MILIINFYLYNVLVWFWKMDEYLKGYLVVVGSLRIVVRSFYIVVSVFYNFMKKKSFNC